MIRIATEKDVDVIYDLIEEGAAESKILGRSKEEIGEVILEHYFLVYIEDEDIVACCSLEIYCKKLSEIRSLFVLPDYRNKGIATELINECIDMAREATVLELLIVTDHIDLFERCGFSEILDGQRPLFIKL